MAAITLSDRARPLHEDPRIHGRRWFLLAMMCLSLVLVVMSVSGLVTAIPTMQEQLNASASQVQWILDAYAVVFAGALLTAGALGDRFGRKRALLSGLVVFAAGSVFAGIASGASQVIAGRAVMGIGAALVMPATLSIITTIFSPEERPRAIGVWAGFAGAGGAIGPIVSGALLERYWWGSALLVNLPLVALTFIAIWSFAPESRDETETPLDPIGAVLSLVGLSALVYAIIQGGEKGWTSTPVVIAAIVAATALGSFLRWELSIEHPMLPLDFFRDRRFTLGSGVIFISFFVLLGFFFLATQYLQFARGYSPLDAGLALLPLPVMFVMVSPPSTTLAAKFGAAPVIGTGLAVIAGGFVMFSRLTPGTSYLYVAIALGVLGAGMAAAAAPGTGEIMSAVPLSKAGVGSAVNDTTRELGGALGIAILGSIANSAYRASVNLSGVALPASAHAHAHESIGGALEVAGSVPGAAVVKARAASAFTTAFTRASAVSVGIALVAVAIVALMAWRSRGDEAETVPDEFGVADLEALENLADLEGVELALVPCRGSEAAE